MTKMMRIATVKATGDRYLVQSMSIPKSGEEARVHCWGEVVACKYLTSGTIEETLARGASTRHQPSKVFLRSAVDVSDEVVVTYALARELVAQAQRKIGGSISTRRRRSR